VRKEIQSEWKGPSAEGLPNRANPSARLDLNPQFSVKINKACDGFIMLKQTDALEGSSFKGKHSIFFMISKNNGKRIAKLEKDLILTKSGNPINLNIITSECHFDSSISYPYTFTLLVANTEHGAPGEG
jgi:hypothetical protein